MILLHMKITTIAILIIIQETCVSDYSAKFGNYYVWQVHYNNRVLLFGIFKTIVDQWNLAEYFDFDWELWDVLFYYECYILPILLLANLDFPIFHSCLLYWNDFITFFTIKVTSDMRFSHSLSSPFR